jgi:deoxyhypusine synthase
MARTSYQGRNLGRAAEVLALMLTEPDNFLVLTISGAMTVGQMGPVFAALIRTGRVHAVIGTGALMTHDVVENLGYPHYEAPSMSDEEAESRGICRVFDSVELESSMDAFGEFVDEHWEDLLPALHDGRPRGSADFCRRLGGLVLRVQPERRGIMSAAAEMGIPLYIPAFSDSEMALNLQHRMVRRGWHGGHPFEGAPVIPFNCMVDLFDYTRRVEAHRTGRLCIFTVGGGVPRNWAQQVAPALDIMELGGLPVHVPKFSRGVRICPDPPSWGHLSGCTYTEGVSWAKFASEAEGGCYAEVMSDATLVLPLLVKGVLERTGLAIP